MINPLEIFQLPRHPRPSTITKFHPMIAKSLFRCAGVLALFSSAQLSAAPTAQCLSEPEVHGLVAYMLPSVAETVIERCAARLPASSYLNTRGNGLVSQLRLGQSAAWPTARDAMAKMAGKDDDSSEMFQIGRAHV